MYIIQITLHTEFNSCFLIVEVTEVADLNLCLFVSKQVVKLHRILEKAAVKASPTVLWCYKKDLGFGRCIIRHFVGYKPLRQALHMCITAWVLWFSCISIVLIQSAKIFLAIIV